MSVIAPERPQGLPARGSGCYPSGMQPLGTVVAFSAAAARAAAELEPTVLDCQVLAGEGLFAQLKRASAGSLLFLLLDDAGDPALAEAVKAARILGLRGGGPAVVVLPPVPVNPGAQATDRLRRAAALTKACVAQPVAPASWAEVVRCFVEPLAVFGLAGVEPREIRALLRPRVALLHACIEGVTPEATELLISCRLRPNASLRELDDAARAAAERAPRATVVLAGPEVAGDGPRVLAASLF